MTQPRHYPRFDTSICPDPDQCEKLYHGRLCFGDSCECCGAVIGVAIPAIPATGRMLDARQHTSADSPCMVPGCEVCE